MRNKYLYLIFSFTLCLFLASCAPSTQIDGLGIVVAMAIDLEEDEVIVTSQIMTPINTSSTEGSTSSSEDIKFVQSRGKTVFDAIRNATLTYDGRLFLSHNSIIVFGEDIAKRGIGDIINFFAYDIGTRETAYLLVAKGFKGYEIFGVPSISDDYLVTLVENSFLTAKSRSIILSEYLKYYFDRGTPVLGVVEVIEKREIEDKLREKSPTRKVLDVSGAAPFFKDKLVGYYSADEMIGFNFIVDEIKNNLIIFEVPDELTERSNFYSKQGRYSTVKIVNSKTKIKAEVKDERIHFNIFVNLKGSLVEETKGLYVPDYTVREGIEDACSKQVATYIKMVMDKAQNQIRLDTFGFGHILHRDHPQVWKEVAENWNQIFTEVSYKVEVKISIVRTGVVDIPTNILRGRE